MDNNKWPAVRGWLPDRQPPGGGGYPGVDDFQGPVGGPYGGPGYGGGGGFFGGPSSGYGQGYGGGGGFFGGPSSGYGQGYGGGGGLFGLPFNLGQLKTFIDRMGGLDGILNTIGKMQRLFGTMQQLAPLMRLLLAKKSSTPDAEEDAEPPRRRRKRGGGQRRRRRSAAGRSGIHPRRGGSSRRRPVAGRRSGSGYARVRAVSGPQGKRTGSRTRDRFRVPDHDDTVDLPPHGLYLP
jgi:hypothetical protein